MPNRQRRRLGGGGRRQRQFFRQRLRFLRGWWRFRGRHRRRRWLLRLRRGWRRRWWRRWLWRGWRRHLRGRRRRRLEHQRYCLRLQVERQGVVAGQPKQCNQQDCVTAKRSDQRWAHRRAAPAARQAAVPPSRPIREGRAGCNRWSISGPKFSYVISYHSIMILPAFRWFLKGGRSPCDGSSVRLRSP